jgi:uncharacterized phage protein gp47/JayE
MSFGVSSTGFNKKLLSDIAAETKTDLETEFGNDIDLDDREPLGQIKGIYDERIYLLWELAEAVYAYLNVQQSEGASLDNLVVLNGVTRLPEGRSKLIVTIEGTPGTIIPIEYEVQKIGDPEIVFVNPSSAEIPPSGSIDLTFEGKELGPLFVSANNIEEVLPVSGITSVDNAEPSTVGREIETDAELKTRRQVSIQNINSPSDQGIRNALLQNVENIVSAVVISNRTNDYVDGRPPKSFESIVDGGLNQDIADVIYENLPAGIEPYGDVNVIITADDGQDVVIGFSKVQEVAIEAEIDLNINDDPNVGVLFPDDGEIQVKNSLVNYFGEFVNNQDIINNQTYDPINAVGGVTGIVAKYKFKSGGSFTTANIVVTAKQKVRIAYADITINFP